VIPEVEGLSEEQAREALRNACTTPPCVEITSEQAFDDDVSRGEAVGTRPAAGQRVDFGATVLLTISQGPEPEPEPSPEPSPTPPPATEPEPDATETETDATEDDG
jgi:serine/threonine-protein kinase